MALSDARLTGRIGVASVSRGPGSSNAAIAVRTARQDGVPFLRSAVGRRERASPLVWRTALQASAVRATDMI